MCALGTAELRGTRHWPFHNARLTKGTSAASKKRAVVLNLVHDVMVEITKLWQI